MTRKDSDKDAERPHYYSQFWLDVAAGRRIIGMPKPNEDGETAEPEAPEPVRKTARVSDSNASDGHVEAPARAAEPVTAPREFIEPEDEEDEEDEPELIETAVDDKDIPDMDLSSADDVEAEDEEREEDDFFDEEDEEEDIGWGNRGRKKPKPTRTTKQPPKKPVKRDRRTGY